MEYDTGIPWTDHQFISGSNTTLIGKDFLAVAVNRPGYSILIEQIFYIFDLKRKSLAMVLDEPGNGYYYLYPSAATCSFLLSRYNNGISQEEVLLYQYERKTRGWNVALSLSDATDTGYGACSSSRSSPAYFVNTVESSGSTLELHIFSY